MSFSDIIISIASEIYKTLGCGYPEVIYHNAMKAEFRIRGYQYDTKRIVPINYMGYNLGYSEIDLVVYDGCDALVLELKAISALTQKERNQIQNYLTSSGVSKGVLINFTQGTKAKGDIEYEVREVMHSEV